MNDAHSLEDAAELVALYTAGALPEAELSAFEEHLVSGCTACQAELRQAAQVPIALWRAVLPVAPDAKVRDALLARITATSSTPAAASPLRDQVVKATPEAAGGGMLISKAAEASWEKTAVEGVAIRILFVDRDNNQFTALVRMVPGSAYPAHVHDGPEQCLVLEGDLRVGDEVLRAGDYQRAAVGSQHGVQSTEHGCLLLITSSLTDQFV